MNGICVCQCNLAMGICTVECTKDGVCITCKSGDKACCEMVQACCDCLAKCLDSGCCCYVSFHNTPVCCGTLLSTQLAQRPDCKSDLAISSPTANRRRGRFFYNALFYTGQLKNSGGRGSCRARVTKAPTITRFYSAAVASFAFSSPRAALVTVPA